MTTTPVKYPRLAAPSAGGQIIAILSGFVIGFSIFTLVNVALLLVCLVFIVRWAVAQAVVGTVKREGEHRDDYTCNCWQCQAVGRWLKKPLPTRLTVDWNAYNAWLAAVTEGMSDTDAGLVREYTTTAMSTETFLQRWAAGPSEPAAAGSEAQGRTSHIRYNGHNPQCTCTSCCDEHSRRGHLWDVQHNVWMIPAWPAEGVGKGHCLNRDNTKCLGCGCTAADTAATKHCTNPGSDHMHDRRLAEEHTAEMRQRADNYAREFQQATGQAMSADLYGAIYHSKLTPNEIKIAKGVELERIRQRYTEQVMRLNAQPSIVLGKAAQIEYTDTHESFRETIDNINARLAAIDGPPRNREV